MLSDFSRERVSYEKDRANPASQFTCYSYTAQLAFPPAPWPSHDFPLILQPCILTLGQKTFFLGWESIFD
jgi:hypothetical protein